jgi:hypothetical protein
MGEFSGMGRNSWGARERLSLGSSMDEGERMEPPKIGLCATPWEPRTFPLSDEDYQVLLDECAAQPVPKDPTPRLRPHRPLKSLPHVLGEEGTSQGGSSISGSLPPSPLPSSSSNAGDYDAADPEWVAEAECGKRTATLQHKAIKR